LGTIEILKALKVPHGLPVVVQPLYILPWIRERLRELG
jgi:hypothetical protein